MRYARWIALVAVTTAMAVAVGCGGDDSGSSSGSQVKAPEGPKALDKLGAGEGEVNLIAWAGYVEDGSTDPKVDWVSDFEKDTGCQVKTKIGNTSDEMVTLMRTGPVRRRVGIRRRDAAPDRGRRRRPGEHRPGPELRRRLRRASRTSRGTASTASRTASRTAAERTC